MALRWPGRLTKVMALKAKRQFIRIDRHERLAGDFGTGTKTVFT